MSDDTPTQRFDAAGDDAPTQRFDAAADAAPTQKLESPAATVPLEVAEERKSRRLIIILASVGGALLLAVLIVLILLLTRDNGTPAVLPTPTPTASPTPTPTPTTTPSATPTPTPTPTTTPAPPPSTDAEVDSFTASSMTVDCSAGDPEITLIWSTSNATKVLFGIDTNDASTGAFFSDIPASGDSDTDFPPGYSPFHYTCGNGSHKYVITAVNDDNGTKDSVVITVTG
jgi:hypothetical protein